LDDENKIEIRGAGKIVTVLGDGYSWDSAALINVSYRDLPPFTAEMLNALRAMLSLTVKPTEAPPKERTCIEPDVEQLRAFINAMFCRAGNGFVSLRTFTDDGSNKVPRVSNAPIQWRVRLSL
jgi:hypothetical protein